MTNIVDQLKQYQPVASAINKKIDQTASDVNGKIQQAAADVVKLQSNLNEKADQTVSKVSKLKSDVNKKLSQTVSDVSQLTSKMNEISSFLNDASIDFGNKPFDLKQFARELVTKQNKQDKQNSSENNDVTENRPVTKKLKQITHKVLVPLVKNIILSEKMLVLLEKQNNKIMSLAKVNQVRTQAGQIIAQPLATPEIEKAVKNTQKILDTYVKSVDKYALRIYNTKPITTTQELKENLSLQHIVDFIQDVLAVYLLLIKVQIKIRKAQDLAIAANAAVQVPVPNLPLALDYTQRATENTAAEQKKLDDLAESFLWVKEVNSKITFYGSKYEKQSAKLQNIQAMLYGFTQTAIASVASDINNAKSQITGSINTQKDSNK